MMRLIDLLVIYLAAGAPFAAHHLVRTSTPLKVLPVIKSLALGMTWPLFLLNRLTSRSVFEPTELSASHAVPPQCGVDVVMLQLMDDLNRLSSAFRCEVNQDNSAFEDLIKNVRLAVEKYAALTFAVYEMAHDESPAPHQSELARIAGRIGDDLLIAGICVHRQSLFKLNTLQAKSKDELFDNFNKLLALVYGSADTDQRKITIPPELQDAAERFCGSVRNIFKASGDVTGAYFATAFFTGDARTRSLAPPSIRGHSVDRIGENVCMNDSATPAPLSRRRHSTKYQGIGGPL